MFDMKMIKFAMLGLSMVLMCVLMPITYAQNRGSEDDIVKQFYPRQWISSDMGGPYDGMGPFAYADADFDGTGKNNYIVAVYSNGVSGMVRVLKKQGNSAEVVATPSFPTMGGVMPGLKMVDVDGDGIPEADVSFSSANGRNNADWVLKWNGSTLVSIGPVSKDPADGAIFTDLNSPVFLDLTDSGKLDLVSSPEDDGDGVVPGTPSIIYSIVNGQYKQSESANYFNSFRRSSGAPTAQVDSFPVSNSSGQYLMTIVNGAGTNNLVSSAMVMLNGVTVADQSRFNQQTKVIKVPVTLQQGSNALNVTMYGAPGSLLTIVVGKAISQ